MKHLELFRNVCEKQTLHRASEASNMTQPAATKLIQELEEMFAVQLFHREKRGMKLTHYGEVIRRHVSILMADIAAMQQEIELVSQGAVGHVRLGVIPSLASDLLALAIANTLAQYPRVQFKIEEQPTTELLTSLARNDLDLTFGRVLDLDTAKDLRIINVYDESFAIVARADHPLARKRSPGWSALSQATWVLPTSGTPMRNLVDGLFTGNFALRPSVAVECTTFEKMRSLIAHTDMLGVLPRTMALQGEADKDLALIRRELGANFAPISLIFRKQFDQPPVIEKFASAVHAAATTLGLA